MGTPPDCPASAVAASDSINVDENMFFMMPGECRVKIMDEMNRGKN